MEGVYWATKSQRLWAWFGLVRASAVSVWSAMLSVAPILQAKYPTVFVGVGKLKGYKLKLHVDPEVTTVAQKPRRVPFALREKVTSKVEDLNAKEIVDRVNGPTSWVSPVHGNCAKGIRGYQVVRRYEKGKCSYHS